MTIEELYQRLGGDFKCVCGRLPGRRFVERFLERYLSDDSAQALLAAVTAGNPEESYRYAMALKGVAGNLGFEDLEKATATLAQVLRGGAVTPEAVTLAKKVESCHLAAVKVIQLYLAER